jgi:curved DNA-binding protein
MADDYYKILGVEKTADATEIKKAYRKLAMKYHPDKTEGDKALEEKFKKISEAYAVLSDPEKKNQYDTYGSAGFQQRFSQEDIFRNFDLGDILKEFGFGGSAGGGFSSFGRGGRQGGFSGGGGNPFFQNAGQGGFWQRQRPLQRQRY